MKTQAIVILALGAALAIYTHKALLKKADHRRNRSHALPAQDPKGASTEDRTIIAQAWAIPAGIGILSAVATGILLKS